MKPIAVNYKSTGLATLLRHREPITKSIRLPRTEELITTSAESLSAPRLILSIDVGTTQSAVAVLYSQLGVIIYWNMRQKQRNLRRHIYQ